MHSHISVRTRNLRLFARVSDTKSNDHLKFGVSTVFGLALFSEGHFFLRLRVQSPACVYKRYVFLFDIRCMFI